MVEMQVGDSKVPIFYLAEFVERRGIGADWR